MPAFWADLFLRGQQNGAWLKVSYQKAKESIEFGFKMAKFITTLVINGPQILKQLYTALKNFVSDLNPFTGLMRTGYSVGIIGFEIIMEIATGGGAALAKLGGRLARMSTNLLETLLNPRHYGELLLDMGDKLWLKLNDAVLTTEQIVRRAVFNSRTKNCFIAGTLVAVGVGELDSKPIEELDLFDLVVTEDVTNLPAGSQDLEHFSGLVSSEQYLLDSYNEVLLEPWYKASFLSIETQGELHIARPLSWFTKYGIVELHDEAWIQLPEQGVDHQMRLMSNLELLNDREIQSLRLKGEFQPVTAVVKHKAPLVLTIVTSEGSCIGVTPEHPLFSETTNTWVNAGDIDCGNWLRTMADSTMVISVDTLFQLPTTVYNLEVRKNHNYFVGKSSVLAHNSYSIAGTRKLKEALDNGTVIPRGPNENALRRLSSEQFEQFLVESRAWTNIAGDYRKVRPWEVALNANLPHAIRRNPIDLDKISSHLTNTGKSTDDLVAELAGNARTASGNNRAWLDIIPNGGGATIGNKGQYVQKQQGEIIYRTITQNDYNHLLSTGRMPPSSTLRPETSTSPFQAFSEDYDGVLVKWYVNLGTIDDLRVIGRTDGTNLVASQFGDMPQAVSGWTDDFVRFKKEGTQVNIQLGVGPGLDIFNDNLIAFERVVVP